ncbi:MAG: hypothetical protein JW917_00450 [Ignavibacteria bacterium]|nr:hypothetical protein [Ignavibacteria bacterium]
MKRIVSILLMLLLLYNAFGFLFPYFHLKKTFKKEAFERIDNFLSEEELIILGFSSEELKDKVYFVHSREFIYNNEMYDIFKTEERNDSIFFKCICDKNETFLEKSFSIYFSTESKPNAKHPYIFNILRNIILTGLLPDTEFNLYNNIIEFAYNFYAFTISIFLDKDTPPPRLV